MECLDSTLRKSFGIVFKSGQTTETTEGLHISTLSEFCKRYQPTIAPRFSTLSVAAWNGVTRWMLVHSPEPFANKGDSGGIVWYKDEGVDVPLGLLIGTLTEHLYRVLPLQAIGELIQSEGYGVAWE